MTDDWSTPQATFDDLERRHPGMLRQRRPFRRPRWYRREPYASVLLGLATFVFVGGSIIGLQALGIGGAP